jgi:DNA helicase-2/ATP-dependent DNA helicase PcrA
VNLNPEQEMAVKFEGQHLLVLAGAGTGKTRTLIERAGHLINSGCEAKKILLLTFTRRAANEMTNRLRLSVGEIASNIMAGTFHRFCLAYMRRWGRHFGVSDFNVIDRDDQSQLMKIVRAQYVEQGKQFPKASTLVNLFSYARNTNQSVEKYLTQFTKYDEKTVEQLARVNESYEQRKYSRGYLDFDDILFLFAKALNENAEIRERVRGLFKHILVDEMQDTNPLQWLILDALRDPAKLFCVGDDAQSIYAFRGADFQNVHAFTERIPGSETLKLTVNYRSTQEILDVSNWLLGQASLNYGKELLAHRGDGPKPQLIDFLSDYDEARWLANDLVDRHESGAAWADHMILARTASCARMTESALLEKKIPYIFIGGTSLMQSAHVRDLFSLLRAALYIDDELAWVRYLTLWPRVGDRTATKAIDLASSSNSLREAYHGLDQLFDNMPHIIDAPREIRKSKNDPHIAVQQAVFYLTSLLMKKYERWEAREKDFDLLIRLSMQFSSLESFIETYTLDPISTSLVEQPQEEDMLKLVTVHSAKGTEAQVVYIIQAQPGIYPHARSLGDLQDEEEERRILYVAMTRARDELIMTRSGGRFAAPNLHGGAIGGNSFEGTVYFLGDIPEGLVDQNIEGFSNAFSRSNTIIPWREEQ